jgi:hypothetical protein
MAIKVYGGGPNPPVRLDKWQNIIGVGWGESEGAGPPIWLTIEANYDPMIISEVMVSLEWIDPEISGLFVGRQIPDDIFNAFSRKSEPGEVEEGAKTHNFHTSGIGGFDDFFAIANYVGPQHGIHTFFVNLKKMRDSLLIWDGATSAELETRKLQMRLKVGWRLGGGAYNENTDLRMVYQLYNGGVPFTNSATYRFLISGATPIHFLQNTIDKDYADPTLGGGWDKDLVMGVIEVDLENQKINFYPEDSAILKDVPA